MGLFDSRKNPIAEADLHAALMASKTVVTLQQASQVDVAAALTALARVESNFDMGAVVADGTEHSYGLWQVNADAHRLDVAQLGQLDAQIDWAAQVWRELQSVVDAAIKGLAARKTAGAAINFQPARDMAQWFNVGWQYGAGGLSAWLNGGNDLSTAGFAAYRAAAGKPVDDSYPGGYSARAATFRKGNDSMVADAPDWWDAVVSASAHQGVAAVVAVGSAIATAPIAAYDAATGALEQKKNAEEEDFFSKLKKAAEQAFVSFVVVPLAILALLIVVAVWLLSRKRLVIA